MDTELRESTWPLFHLLFLLRQFVHSSLSCPFFLFTFNFNPDLIYPPDSPHSARPPRAPEVISGVQDSCREGPAPPAQRVRTRSRDASGCTAKYLLVLTNGEDRVIEGPPSPRDKATWLFQTVDCWQRGLGRRPPSWARSSVCISAFYVQL